MENEKKSIKDTKKTNKKIIITVSAICLGFLIICGLYYWISSIINNNNSTDAPEIKFYSEAYSVDIMNDPTYLDLDRQFYFVNNATGVTIAITDDDASDVPESIKSAFVCVRQYIQYAISGDSQGLNGLFSDKYYANGGEKKQNFTEQKIYDIYIYGDSSADTDSGVEFTVEYKIKHNNGSFRSDMGSDCSRKEYFVINDYNGNSRIDLIYTNKSVN